MTLKTETLTLPALPAETSAQALQDLRMALHRGGVLPAWCKCLEGQESAFFQDALGITSKEDYLVFRDHLKSLINVLAAGQLPLKAAMRQRGGCSGSQWRKDANAQTITRLIEIRRAGKVWSAMQATQKLAA